MDSLDPGQRPVGAVRDPVADLVRLGKEEFRRRLGATDNDFDAPVWNVRTLKRRAAERGTLSLGFTRHTLNGAPFPKAYADVIKSLTILHASSIALMSQTILAARVLWEAIESRRGGNAEAFTWSSLCLQDLGEVERLLSEPRTPSSAYNIATRIAGLIHELEERNICPRLYYHVQLPLPQDYNRRTIAGREARLDKLPSERAMRGLAEIYSIHAVTPPDRLLAAAIALLVVTGLRVGELLGLPYDCEVEEKRDGSLVYGIRYYKEKTIDEGNIFAVRWLTPTQAKLGRAAIAEIREITAPAREQARRLEQHPERVVIPGFELGDRMRDDDVMRAIGVQYSALWKIPSDVLPRYADAEGRYYQVRDVEAYLTAKQTHPLWTVDLGKGIQQSLSETLLIAPKYYFAARRTTQLALITPVSHSQIGNFLKSNGLNKSAFERFDIREEDGSFCGISSHQLRHWLNDLADKGGMPLELQTRWFGRSDDRQTEWYHHATAEERMDWVKAGLSAKDFSGELVDFCDALPQDQVAEFLEGQIQAVHITRLGVCVHNYALSPCPYYLNCVRGCPDYLRTRGDQRERAQLIQLVEDTTKVRTTALAQAEALGTGMVNAWLQGCDETITGALRALAVDNLEELPVGEPVRPFEGRPNKFEPM